MRTLLISLSVAVLAGLPAGRLRAQGLQVVARNTADSVVLRWAPLGAEVWERGNRFGYKVERFTIDPRKKERPAAVRIGPDSLKAWPLERFKSGFPPNHPYAPAVAQAVYGRTFMAGTGAADLGSAAKADNELHMRQSFALVFADLDAGIADALGLRWADRDVKADGIYLYRITALDPEHRDTALAAVNRRLGPDPVPAPPAPTAGGEEHSVKLRWPLYTGERAFTAFWIERSSDGNRWERLNAQPYMQFGASGSGATEAQFTDSLAGYGVARQYRIRGITSFGETSEPSAPVRAMGRDRTPPPNPVMKEVKDEHGKLVVHWEQPEASPDLSGFRVAKAPTAEGRFVPLHAGLLPVTARSFTDTSTFLLGENHYIVYAVDTAGNESASMGGYGFLVDSIAPAPPTGLTGKIDTNGIVTLRWAMGREPDLMGYRVFMANAPDHEFTNLSPAPFADTAWTDTITLKTLTKRICYKVVAVDRNFNHSAMSAMLTLARPDVVPPVAPVFSGYAVSDSGVVLRFVPSSSPDAARYALFRKEQQGGAYRPIAQWPAAQALQSFTDTSAAGPEFYSYRLEVADSAGNLARSPVEVAVQVPRRKSRTALQGLEAHYDAAQQAVVLAWAVPAREVKHYVVYRSRNDAAPAAIGSAPKQAASFVDKDLPGKGGYVYFLKAVFADGTVSAVARSAALQAP